MTHVITGQPSDERVLALLQSNDKVCVSIIIPLTANPAERKIGKELLRKAIQKVKQYLADQYEDITSVRLSQSLDDLNEAINWEHNMSGIGLFVSEHIKWSVPFIFPVKEKIIVNDFFELRDILYDHSYVVPYKVLYLTGKEAKLFDGKLNVLQEIGNAYFPRAYEDDYEYSRSSRGSSYMGFFKEYERDQSEMRKLRYERFIKGADNALSHHLDSNAKLVIAGPENDLASFKKQTRHSDNIVGQLNGNYDHRPRHELSQLAWMALCASVDRQKQELVREFEELAGSREGLSGLQDIWKAVMEGRGATLFVEKDFMHVGFLTAQDDYHLHLTPPKGMHKTLPDAVNVLIKTMLRKNGTVIILENDMLSVWGHIGLITRY